MSASPTAFDTWWEVYPKKSGKGAARKAYAAATIRIGKPDAHQTLIEAVTRYAASPKARGEFAWNPTTWLNQDHWEDAPSVWNNSSLPFKSAEPMKYRA